MADYASLSTQIDAIKSEITASLNASVYSAQDLVFVASAVDKLGSMLGVNDIVAATENKVATLESTKTAALGTLEAKRVTSLADMETARVSSINQISNASISLHPFFTVGV
jgi:hypothetical protein